MFSGKLMSQLRRRLGKAGVLEGGDIGERYLTDAARENPCRPMAVLRPASTDDVSFIMAACHKAGQRIVVQGGLTGLCSGATPQAGEIALSLERMSGVEELDKDSMTMTVLAGTPLETIQESAATAGFRFPLDLGARGSCTIGGNISTNAGGNEVIRYGMTRALILGLEVVLPDGTVIASLNKMLKNNAGFDLKQLFIGTEGALGVVTRAVLRLFPEPVSRFTALSALDDFPNVLRLLTHLTKRFGGGLSAFEVMWADYYDYVIANVRASRSPFKERYPIYVLAEFEGLQPDSDGALFEAALAEAMEAGMLRDVIVAKSGNDSEAFWRIRDGIGELVPKLTDAVHFDVSVQVNRTAELVERVKKDLEKAFGGITQLTFGHLGDGNLHLVASTGKPEDRQKIAKLVYERVGELNGSISAEHGIGMDKKKYLPLSRSENEIELMRKLKAMMDPKAILNSGRVIP